MTWVEIAYVVFIVVLCALIRSTGYKPPSE
jgi:hypothetical protein